MRDTSVRLDPKSRRPQFALRTPAHCDSLIVRGGVSAIAVVAHPVLGVDVADDRLDGGASFRLAFDGAVICRAWPVIQTRKWFGWLRPR